MNLKVNLRRGTQHNFIQRGSALTSNPLPFYIPFLTEKPPFSIILLTNITLFTYLALEAREKLPGDEVTHMGFSDI